MRNRMETFPAGQNYLVTGDFNIYRHTEPAYQYMISAANGAAGVVVDPISREGNWHVNAAFADVHTQSPRTTQFGGGANGGMDDRFDMILVAPAIEDGEGFDILPSTYTALGQDGLHFDDALNQPPYVVVDSVTAHALHDASDHLPVFADFQGFSLLAVDAALDLGTAIVGATVTEDLGVGNDATAPADDLDYSLAAPAGFTAPAGSFSLGPGQNGLHAIGLDTQAAAFHSGDLTVTSDDPDRPQVTVPLDGTVLDHAVPSTEAGNVVTSAQLSLGIVAAGDSATADAVVHNVGAGPLQALLNVYDFELTGDPRFELAGGFTEGSVGTAPVGWTVLFDAAGAGAGPYSGTLVLGTRDQPDLPGAIGLADLTWDLDVTVTDDANHVAIGAELPERAGLLGLFPNPFRRTTILKVGVLTPGPARATVYDVGGRVVRRLVTGSLPAGRHTVSWDGRDETGADATPGIYFVRLELVETVETRKVLRIR